MCGGVRAQYANEPVAAPEFRTDEIAVRAQCFAQGGDVNLEVLFRYYDARPHPVEKLLFCDERAVGLQQDQKEVEGARAEHDRERGRVGSRRSGLDHGKALSGTLWLRPSSPAQTLGCHRTPYEDDRDLDVRSRELAL